MKENEKKHKEELICKINKDVGELERTRKKLLDGLEKIGNEIQAFESEKAGILRERSKILKERANKLSDRKTYLLISHHEAYKNRWYNYYESGIYESKSGKNKIIFHSNDRVLVDNPLDLFARLREAYPGINLGEIDAVYAYCGAHFNFDEIIPVLRQLAEPSNITIVKCNCHINDLGKYNKDCSQKYSEITLRWSECLGKDTVGMQMDWLLRN